MYKRGENKKGQLTVFVILAIIIVAVIAVFFLFKAGKIPILQTGKAENPQSFMEACLESKIREAIREIPLHGGYISNPLNKTFKLGKENPIDIAYLCYTKGTFFPCVNKEPALFQHIQDEIKKYISKDVEACFNNLASNLEKQGYSISDKKYHGFDVKIELQRVVVDINGKLDLMRAEESTKYDGFRIEKSSKLYEIIQAVQEAVNSEALNCEFSYTGYMFLYPQFDIDLFLARDSSKVYIVKDKNTEEEFRFVVRGCIMPAGF